MNQLAARPAPSRLTHALAIVTVIGALPLVLLGAEVTTKGVGMVDSVAVRSPWYFVTEWMNERGLGWLIEHGHRQVGWVVGMLAIATAVAALVFDERMGIKLLAVGALAAVIVQGMLGIFRIHLHAMFGSNTALVHGAFAAVVLSLLLTLALASSSTWSVGVMDSGRVNSLRTWCGVTVIAMLVQIVLGGFIRHKDVSLAGRLHLLNAFVVFAFLFIVIKHAREADYDSFKGLSRAIMALLTIQIMLGAEAWMAWMKRHYLPGAAIEESVAMQLTRSAHYVVGAFLFATTVALAVKAFWAPARPEAVR